MRQLFCLALVWALAACGGGEPSAPAAPPAPAAPQTGFTTGVPPLSSDTYDMRDIAELGLSGEESMRDIANLLQSKFGAHEPVEGDYSELINIVEEGANVTIIFSIDGMLDDSMRSAQHVVEAFLPAGNWTPVTGYGVRYKCWPSRGHTDWSPAPCH